MIINFIISTVLFALILATIVGLIFFILYAIKLEWVNKRKHGWISKVILIAFLLAVIGGIFRTIQAGFNCYKSTGGITCGGSAPEDDRDFVFPVPK